MPILYINGQPWRVPETEVRGFLQRGFRTTPPVTVTEVAAGEPIAPEPIPPVVIPAAAGEPLNINDASMSAIAKTLPQVGTVAARKLVNARKVAPFRSVEDLIAAEPEVDWLSLAHLYRFE